MTLVSQERQERATPAAPEDARSSWTSVAFMVEAILLLVFLIASFAVLTWVFSSSLNSSVESRTQDAAVIAASTVAEHFAADPTDVEPEVQLGDLRVVTSVTEEPRAAGTMFRAEIAVYDTSAAGTASSDGSGNGSGTASGEPVYTLSTANYRSGVS